MSVCVNGKDQCNVSLKELPGQYYINYVVNNINIPPHSSVIINMPSLEIANGSIEVMPEDLDNNPSTNQQLANGKVFAVSIPKSGTNLLRKCLELITKKGYSQPNSSDYVSLKPEHFTFLHHNSFLIAHSIANQSNIDIFGKSEFKAVFILRDPRDQIVSLAYHIKKYNQWPWLSNYTIEELCMILIKDMSQIYGAPGCFNEALKNLKGIDSYYSLYLTWRFVKNVYVTTFEKLVGLQGGGSSEEQFNEIKKISRHFDYNLTDEQIIHIQNNLYGGTPTFREGKIGSWRLIFKAEHIAVFKEIAGQFLIDLGIEKDMNW